MHRNTTIGEISIPPKPPGIILRILHNTGSVRLWIKRTIGLYGSGFTHDNIALAITTHMKIDNRISRSDASALRKLAITNIRILFKTLPKTSISVDLRGTAI
jgi:hypothetical protein